MKNLLGKNVKINDDTIVRVAKIAGIVAIVVSTQNAFAKIAQAKTN